MAPLPVPTADAAVDEDATFHLKRGTRVVLSGLKARPELNGRLAVVEADTTDQGNARVPCRLLMATGGALYLPGALLGVKACNVKAAPVVPETKVEETADAVRDTLASAMGPDVADEVAKHLKCTRCLGSCEVNTPCRVEHPPHMQVDNGGSYGRDGNLQFRHCLACDSSYTIACDPDDYEMKNKRYQRGPRYCFSGKHTLAAIPPEDKRRNYGDTVVKLDVDSDLQGRIDALPETHPDVTTLVIGSSGSYDDHFKPELCVKLPKLEEIQLIDVAFAKVALNEQLTPKLRRVQLQNVPDDCALDLSIPGLTHFSIHYFRGDPTALEDMLDKATKLESFESYKLWAMDHISFASNHLTDIKLHRSDLLRSIDLYAPRLLNLNLQACYGLERIDIKDSHPTLSHDLPDGFQPTRFSVSHMNATLDRSLVLYLMEHPRVNYEDDGGDSDDEFGMGGGGMNPMEALFQQIHQGMNNGMNPMEALFQQMERMNNGDGDGDETFDDDDDDDDDDDSYSWETDDGEEEEEEEEEGDDDDDDGLANGPRIVEITSDGDDP